MFSREFPRRAIRRPGPVLSALSLFLTLFLAVPPQFVALAGDILRGAGPAAVSHGVAVQGQTSAAVQAGAPSGADTLARTTQALSAIKNMQAAARAAAITGPNNLGADPNHPGTQLPNVPNGLGVGGLQVAPGVGTNPSLWQGAALPTQTTSGAKTNVSIVQSAQQALLNWQTFNIGKNTVLTFDQTAGGANASEWIAFNKVNDPSGVPSQILGSIDALGQVYIINANGIIFGGSSQINLHTLVASALPINDNLIARGLLNNPDNQFLFSAIPIPAGINGTPAFTPPASNTPTGQYGDVTVQAGAQINSPTTADHVGGRVALIGANVENDGTITTPDGQTILAGGLQVGLAAHATSDPSLRGLDVFVGQVGDYAGAATNNGLIEAPRADVTITGENVDQFGFIDSSTSVSLNGRIDLLANYNAVSNATGNGVQANAALGPFLYKSSGQVTFGPDSVTQIVPEYDSTERVVGTQLALNSQINVQGLALHLDAGSLVFAPSADVTLNAGVWSFYLIGANLNSSFVLSDGQIYLDSGAVIDVSGSKDVSASVSENIVAAQLLGPELANSPLQRDGALRGQTVYVDITNTGTYNGHTWIGSPIGDLTGYASLVQRTVGELTTSGGTVSLNAGGSVVLQPGSNVNVSGGWINYAGANVQTTQVTDIYGHVFDISKATPDRVYSGIVNGFTDVHSKWGIVDTFGSSFAGTHFEAGFTQGGSGGSISITSPGMAIDGELSGQTFAGPRQLTSPPAASNLSLSFTAQTNSPPVFLTQSPTSPLVTFDDSIHQSPADPFQLDASGHPLALRSDRVDLVALPTALVNDAGFGNVSINDPNGDFSLPEASSLNFGVKGSFAFTGANASIAGDMSAPGGVLAFRLFDISPDVAQQLSLTPGAQTPPPDPNRGLFQLASTSTLNVAGQLVDDRPLSAQSPTAPYSINGGSVSIDAYTARLEPGSEIDVSGGAIAAASGGVSYGNAGRIHIGTGQDLGIQSVLGGTLQLDAELRGFSGAAGGSLDLQASAFQIGGDSAPSGVFLLQPDFFNSGGFSSFSLSGLGIATGVPFEYVPGILITPGTTLDPVVQSVEATTTGPLALVPIVLPEALRTPVNLSFNAVGVVDAFSNALVVRGDLMLGTGATIDAGARGNISLTGKTAAILGSVFASGGQISVTGANSSFLLFAGDSSDGPLPTVDLGPASILSTAGMTLLSPDPRGFRTGTVLAGGNITVSGNIVAESGSTLDVSGATGILDLEPGYSGGSSNSPVPNGPDLIATRVDSNGGTITLKGSQELYSDAILRGAAGGPSAIGGSLFVSSGKFIPPGSNIILTPLDPTVTVVQSGLTIPVAFYSLGQTAIGHAVVNGNGIPLSDGGHLTADAFNSSGLAALTLQGTVQFSGPVTIDAPRSIVVGTGGAIYADAPVVLTAPYVSLGTAFRPPFGQDEIDNAFTVAGQPFFFAPSFGPGSFSVSASLIDVGNLSLQGIGSANLVATNGDVRGDGTFDIAGSLSITAGQIYPTTETSFTLAAYDYTTNGASHSGSITLAASGSRPLPFSAGGQLNIYSSIINDAGVLRAPIGTINVGLDSTGVRPIDQITGQGVPLAQQVNLLSGSVTSVSAIDPSTGKALIIPYGFNQNGTSWIDPAGNDITVSGVPSKSINIAGANVSDEPGSTIDIRGGGDLFSYQFQTGVTGTIDILNTSSSFAIVPGYGSGYAPYAPYNANAGAPDIGYTNSNLHVGDQIYLNGTNGLPAGTYTLLPARYALLPGAFLITPSSATPQNMAVTQPDGSIIVSGYKFNGFDSPTAQPLFASFEVDSASVIASRALYNNYSANTFLRQSAIDHGVTAPRLPIDSGHLLFDATQTMAVLGSLQSQAPTGGSGGLVDISSPLDILIAGPGVSGSPGELVLDSSALSAFGAESLLIGGIRQATTDGTSVTVTTNNITVDNAGASLTGPDVILVANKDLTVSNGSDIEQSGTLSGSAESLLIGNSTVAGSGDGVLLRVSADPAAQLARLGVNASTIPHEIIGANAHIAGASITLDSTYGTSLDPSAVLTGSALNLDSGQISIQLPDGATPQNTAGLVLAGVALQNLQSISALSLLSYSSIDIYGTGQINASNSLALHAGEIRGFNSGGLVDFMAKSIVLDNSPNGIAPGAVAAQNGSIQFDANTIQFGTNALRIDQFLDATFNSSNGIQLQGNGSLSVQGDLTVSAPIIAATTGATQTISATGAIALLSSPSTPTQLSSSGLGGQVTFVGASVDDNANIVLPSGIVTLHATSGDVTVGDAATTKIDVGGTAQTFFDVVKYTSGGQVNLVADSGDVNIAAGATVNVAAQSGGANGGTISISAPQGTFTLAGAITGGGGANGSNGIFSLDIRTLPSLGALDAALNAGMFTDSRSIRVRDGDVVVDGTAISHTFDLSADNGSITVAGTVDASGVTGGAINLDASGSVVLQNGSLLTVAAQNFDDAGKGGAISLEAGSEINGVIDSAALLDIQTGSTIDLSVAAQNANSAALGDFSGKLHLRAPQLANASDLQMAPINGTIIGASAIVIEGYKLFDLTGTSGTITSSVQSAVKTNGAAFVGAAGVTTPAYTAMVDRLLANNQSLAPITVIEAGAEIINRNGNLTLGASNSTPSSDWDLSTYRFGPNDAAGDLTLRASGNLVFFNALSDGFTSSAYNATLLDQNTLLPANEQSWSYRMAAGADFGASDFHRVQPLASLGADTGSLLLGKNYGNDVFPPTGRNALTANAVATRFQVIRTGSGDIDIAAGRNVALLNELSTIYTAGTQVLDASSLPGGTFDLPILDASGGQSALGAVQQSPSYPAQYSFAGGNVTISAQQDIIHQTRDNSNALIDDSSKELPINWLYRRGYVDPVTGQFGVAKFGDIASTTWWIDFSNFFEGVGALGGGNVTLAAGRDVKNVDAVAPTNARTPGTDSGGNKLAPDAASLVELGGGDVSVNAGHDINGGVYYVERGTGTLTAGNTITTNSTRSPSLQRIQAVPQILNQLTWLPTTLFLGKGSFNIAADGNVLLGPTVNPFLLPGGYNNTFWDKSYFSTYAASSAVSVQSLTGDVTLREASTVPGSNVQPILQSWFQNVLLLKTTASTTSFFQPWLRLDETSIVPFSQMLSLAPPTLDVVSFEGSTNLVGSITLSPSATGNLEVLASKAFNALNPNGTSIIAGAQKTTWSAATINLSDADPTRIPGIDSPLAYQLFGGLIAALASTTGTTFLNSVNSLFSETGSTTGQAGVLQTKQALHAPGLLHASDPVPVRIFTQSNDISGLTLFSAKSAEVIAGRDLTDVALYIQNNAASDVSVVSAGRDIVAYDPNSTLRVAAQSPGNILNTNSGPTAGDIQISGPGALEVLAGRNLDLGVGPSNSNGTGVGITSIGNARNPYLPFDGASIVAGAGIGVSDGLTNSKLDFDTFISDYLDPASSGTQSARYLPDLGMLLGLTNATNSDIWSAFNQLSKQRQDALALDIFYLVLRDSGRDRNNPASANFGNFDEGFAAIAALFPDSVNWQGDISLTSREIKTKNGGDIAIFAPGGQLSVGLDISGTQAADQGILTEHGGNISIFTKRDVNVGTSRIFTLRGGNEIIWSSNGDIAAGSSSKTVQAAPPTRVLIDPQSGDVQTDLAGLATGGGIGVLETVAGVPPSDVDLIAPNGTINAGDAGIRVSGNLSLAALVVLNASNIQVGGTSSGVPTVAAPNIGSLTSASNTAAASSNAAQQLAQNSAPPQQEDVPSIIDVEVLGYGGGEDDEEQRRKKKQQQQNQASLRENAEQVAIQTTKRLPRNASL